MKSIRFINKRYEIVKELKGGMGIVYFCVDHENEIPVAIKTLLPKYSDNMELNKTFFRECENWISLGQLPNIVFAQEVIKWDSQYYLIMELISASKGMQDASLRSLLEYGYIFPTREMLMIVLQIANGMKNACKRIQGLIHGDLKPENILVNDDKYVYITDFGLSRVLNWKLPSIPLNLNKSNNINCQKTQPSIMGGGGGTPLYMAPEQWDEDSTNDQRADIYSFGCIFYELLTKKPFISGRTVEEIRLSSTKPWINLDSMEEKRFNRILERCLQADPLKRYDSWVDLYSELQNLYYSLFGDDFGVIGLDQIIEEKKEMTQSYSFITIGDAYLEIGEHAKAINNYEKAISFSKEIREHNPVEFLADWRIAQSYISFNQPKMAVSKFETMQKQLPEGVLSSYCYDFANSYLLCGEVNNAILLYKKVLSVDADNSVQTNCLFGLGKIYLQHGDVENAVNQFNKALINSNTIDEDSGGIGNPLVQRGYILAYLGEAYRLQNQNIKALNSFQNALRIFSNFGIFSEVANCIFSCGLVEDAQGNYHVAIDHFKKSYQIYKEIGDEFGSEQSLRAKMLAELRSM
jgi:serine/threonine protein kinase